MKRITALLIALFAAALLLTACRDTPPSDTAPTPTTTAAPVTEPHAEAIELVKDGSAHYRVVRAERASQNAIDAATDIRQLIGDATGVFPDFTTDWVKRGAELDHTIPEILVGSTDYRESAEALVGVPYGDYVITRVGSKLVINAWSDTGLLQAVTAFKEAVRQNARADLLTFPADLRLTGTAIAIANALPHYEGGSLRAVYDAGNENQLIIIDETDPDEYAAYCKLLEDAGYTLYTQNAITDNRFATYHNAEYVITAGYYAYESAARIIIEPRTTLPALETENRYTKIIEPSFAMLGLEYMQGDELTENGICFIWQLSDGSYIIVDGGFNRARDAKALYNYLQEHAPDPDNITIAAWVITHAHSDHHGAYLQFSQHYSHKVKLELLIGNFPSDIELAEGGFNPFDDAGEKILNYLPNYSGAEFVKAHVGQEFFVRDAKLEILYTLESFAPSDLTYYNTSSLIFSLEIAGQRFMILGDASNNACEIASEMYGEYLKSDIVHAAHHGYSAGSDSNNTRGVATLYTLTAAPLVLWPVGEKDYANIHQHTHSAHLQNLASTKEIIVAGSRDVRFMLPYTVGTSGYPSILQ